MQTAELLLLLLVVVAALVTLARHLRTPYPVLLLMGGLALGAMPNARPIEVAPDAILLVLPPKSSRAFYLIRSFRTDIGNIASLAVGLVLAARSRGGHALALVPGMTVPVAIALGAIVSPPDEVAALAILGRLAASTRDSASQRVSSTMRPR